MIPGAIIAISCWVLVCILLVLLLLAGAMRPDPIEPWTPDSANLDWLYGLEDDAEVLLTADDREDMRAWGVTW